MRRPDRLGPIGGPPTAPPLPPRPPRHRPNLFRPLTLAAVVAAAFAAGTPGSPLRSIGWALALAVLIGALVATSARRPAAVGLGLAGAAFIPWLGIRMSPWLTSINLLVATGLLLASLGLPAAGSLRVTVGHHLARLARAFAGLPLGPSHLWQSARSSLNGSDGANLRRLVPSILVGLATFAAGLLVLASGDALLASFVDVGGLLGSVVGRVVGALCGAAAFALLLGAIHVPGSVDTAPRRWAAPALPTLFGIGGLAIAIGCYAATQLSAAVLGADFVQGRTGLTYAEYARGGFFQMVFVTFVSVSVIGIARSVIQAESEAARRLRVGAAVLTVGVVGTVVSAVVKLSVYADTFGLTMLRVYTVVFACWLGLVAVLAFATLLRRSASWFAPALLGSMCVGAFAMNVVNPERIVAEHNLDRAESTGKLDVDYLSRLSLDAAPTILSRLDTVDAVFEDRFRSDAPVVDAAELLASDWCNRLLADPFAKDSAPHSDNDGFAYNLASDRAIDSATEHCAGA